MIGAGLSVLGRDLQMSLKRKASCVTAKSERCFATNSRGSGRVDEVVSVRSD